MKLWMKVVPSVVLDRERCTLLVQTIILGCYHACTTSINIQDENEKFRLSYFRYVGCSRCMHPDRDA
jgi:hypothetical protein